MDRGDNLAGIGSFNGISGNPSKSDDPVRPVSYDASAVDAAHAEVFDFVDIGIVEDDERRIATQFERQFLHRVRPLFRA
jgi:hypothetical protein